MEARKPKDDHGKIILKVGKGLISCSGCGSGIFVYGDHASIQITISEDGQIEYGEATYAGIVSAHSLAPTTRQFSFFFTIFLPPFLAIIRSLRSYNQIVQHFDPDDFPRLFQPLPYLLIFD